MVKIKKLEAREILDSRGHPTIETTIILDSGHQGTSAAPAGSSTSKKEAVELRDHDPERFNGLGVLKAVNLSNTVIAQKLIGLDPTKQTLIDQTLIDLDGTSDKSRLGSNTILAASQACLKAAASFYQLPLYHYIFKKYQLISQLNKLPTPSFNIINGGAHSNNNLDFQEFHIVPSLRFSYSKSLIIGLSIYQALKNTLIKRQVVPSLGDEGGFAPNLFTNLDALAIILEAIEQTGYRFAQDVFLGLDPAANQFFKNGQYTIKDRAQPFSAEELIVYYANLNQQYHLLFLEDPLEENDFNGWTQLTARLSDKTLIIGDDLLVTSKTLAQKAITKKACNAILIKPNQVGTVSEVIEVIKLCRQHQFKIIVSHRSGETNDQFIADFAVGVGADYTKFGAPARGERVSKYNRLLKIESEITKNI